MEPRHDHRPDAARRRRLSVLAQGEGVLLAERWAALGIDPECALVRGPEVGLIALRGRMGGGGAPFNFGEATATRATVRLAVIDALAHDEAMAARIDEQVIAPLERAIAARDGRRAEETAATRVDFFTMVRGDD